MPNLWVFCFPPFSWEETISRIDLADFSLCIVGYNRFWLKVADEESQVYSAWISQIPCEKCDGLVRERLLFTTMVFPRRREGIKPWTNARDPGPKSGTKFCQQNIAVKHECIKLKFGLNVDYRLFFEMHISIFLHLPYFYYMQVKYRTMPWNTDPGPTFSVLTMSRNS